MSGAPSGGRVAVVLHTHMPYVEGYGTWPFGEEWLWEAMATSYLPLLDLLDGGAPLTLSLTPVVCDQLEAPGAHERCVAFVRDVREASHALDVAACREAGRDDLAGELERAGGEYAVAAERLAALEGGLLPGLARHAAWTSSATHAVLPLLATDAGVRLQVRTGIDSHRARFGAGWRGGFWLPECAYAPWLDPLLEEAGIHAVCVELTDQFGLGDERHLRPLRTPDGPLLVPVDRLLMDLVWGADGYPSGPAYRDSHARTARDHHPWANDGAVYDPARAAAQARADAGDLAERCAARVAGGGLAVLAFDTELFGHWWHEGPAFLEAFVVEAERIGLPVVGLDDALAGAEVEALPDGLDEIVSWGQPRTLWTWSNPVVADVAAGQRDAELRTVAAGRAVTPDAARQLLAVQSSDWAFLITLDTAGDYPRERLAGHRAALDAELAGTALPGADARSLAPHLSVAALLEP